MQKTIIANWKSNPATSAEAKKLLAGYGRAKSVNKIVVCPPNVYLQEAGQMLGKKQNIYLGAQNCFWQNNGAYTGEVSPLMLRDLGCKYVILGHSERVMILGETNEMTAKKVKAALACGLLAVICVGEDKAEKENKETFNVIARELKASLHYIKRNQASKIIIAYEPLWAIGSGKNCAVDEALTAILYIKKLLAEMFGKRVGESVRVLYGGSVNSENASEYLQNKWIDGLLVGGASLSIAEFLQIVKK